ncbi:MAG: class I SAM-dependent methyltransferase [Clostridiales Family XIII bacterium]|jgi:predicted RNA methylase|nr:class I SAM-dependent methyltransferase [Clostridiales Family XIII bacterium]
MLFQWTDEKIELYVRASRYTGFHRKLAAYISPLLTENDTLTDIGCGPGLIALTLAPMVKSIMTIDVDARVTGYLTREAEKAHVKNITTITADIADVADTACDVALMCYFGIPEERLVKILDTAKRLTVIITHGAGTAYAPSKISATVRRSYATDMEEFLCAGCYDYKRIDEKLNFGQPLKSKDEARCFFELYCKETIPEVRLKKIEKQIDQLQPTDDSIYPYFFPCLKDVAIFMIKSNKK